MENFHLPIFPEGSLANSVTTTIWLGVCITAFFNLRLGWALSGLVIPGYLAPLCVIKPWAAVVIIAEGIITYYAVYLTSEKLGPKLGVTNFFGRDRFFAMLIASVLVRLALDGVALPALGQWINESFHLRFDYRGQLHSFGLIIVALIANQFWKPGFLKGMGPLAVNLGLTYAATVFLLIPLTNFNLSSLNYMYEDLATSLLSSPKGYVIILTTSLIASRFNLLYGFEYNGILIPSLLALQWYQPVKLVSTFTEIFIILGLATVTMKLPGVKNITMEGARKILLFFNISFAYKLLLGFAIGALAPQVKVSDYYGFGYLLPSLLAIKMYDKKIALKVTRVTIQTSLTALVLASLTGYALTLIPFSKVELVPGNRGNQMAVPLRSNRTSVDAMQSHKIQLYRKIENASYQPPLPLELESFHDGLNLLRVYIEQTNPFEHPRMDHPILLSAQRKLSICNYQVYWHSEGVWSLQEKKPRRGWGIYFLYPVNTSELLITAPAPLEEWGVMESAMEIANGLSARYVALGGVSRKANLDGSSDPLQNSASCLRVFQNVFGRSGTMQIRGYQSAALRAASREIKARKQGTLDENSFDSGLWVTRSIPEDLKFSQLEKLIPGYVLHWKPFPLNNVLRDYDSAPHNELFLSRKDRRKLFFKPAFQDFSLPSSAGAMNLEGYLQDWLLSGKINIAPRGSNAFQLPTLEEMLYMDQEVVTPICHLLDNGYVGGSWTDDALEELQAISRSAGALGYQLIRYRHIASETDYLILQEQDQAESRKGWGLYAFRPGREAKDYLVSAPRPLHEGSVFEYSISLFENLNAKALLISGSHPDANVDGTADVIREANKVNLFNLVHQTLLREFSGRPMLSVFCRAFGFGPERENFDADAILSFHSGIWNREGLDPLPREFVQRLNQDGLELVFADGSPSVTGYEVGSFFPARYLDQTQEQELALLWLSPIARSSYRRQDENLAQIQQFEILGLPQKEGDISAMATQSQSQPEGQSAPWNMNDGLKLRLQSHEYALTQDVTLLQGLIENWIHSGRLQLERWVDINSKQAFLAWKDGGGRLWALVNLSPRSGELSASATAEKRWTQSEVIRFIQTRDFWLEVGGTDP